ncbi:MAG: hypothetical protein PVH17_04740 [Anaerolineae bacterium]
MWSALRGNTWPPVEADPEQERRERWRAWVRENEEEPDIPRRSRHEDTSGVEGVWRASPARHIPSTPVC